MATMIPSMPLDVEIRSDEDKIFYKLRDSLPKEVYVAHSFVIYDQNKTTGEYYKSEIDFLIIVPDVGCLIVESKNAKIYPEIKAGLTFNYGDHEVPTDYLWHLPDGKVMKYNGPFRQAARSKYNFEKYLKEGRVAKFGYGNKISFATCVCLPLIDSNTITNWNLPADAGSPKFIINLNDLKPENKDKLYNRIVDIIETQRNKNDYVMNDRECQGFIQSVIAPSCNLIPSKHFFINLQNERLDAFLHQQLVILDFMEEQKIAVIGGGAGTGKTKIALEKARRLNDEGKKVLFLCFNKKLKEHLTENYQYDNVRFETIDSLYYSYFKSDAKGNYNPLRKRIEDDYGKGIFPYKHFVIDEAQDLGRKDVEGSGLLKLLQDIVEMEEDSCCYFFYDKYQLVQSKEIPSVIQNADCKMMLYRNCRNTEKIATTSYKVFTKDELSKRDLKGFEEGVNPKAINCSKDETYEKVEKMVTSLRAKGYNDIVILTAKEENTSSLYERASGESLFFGGFKCLFTTCRKFKGLEAEAIIITDLDGDVLLNSDKRLLFYVGASRAKFDLNLVFNLTAEECKQWLDKSGHKSPFFSPNLLYTAFETEMFK